ncbi:MAG: hypothetical protein CVU81_02925, partial [Euryarchaeota archaeon HGW-Euryarchaeota-1]
ICMNEIKTQIGFRMEGNLKRQPSQQGPPTETGSVEVEIKGKFIFDRKEFQDEGTVADKVVGRIIYEPKQAIYDFCSLNPLKEKYKKIIVEQSRKVYEEVKATFNLQKID